LKIRMDPRACRGCLRCELACSYHRSGHRSFDPSISSTRVLRDNDTGETSMTIDETCDLCSNEKSPLCVRHCVFGARGVVS